MQRFWFLTTATPCDTGRLTRFRSIKSGCSTMGVKYYCDYKHDECNRFQSHNYCCMFTVCWVERVANRIKEPIDLRFAPLLLFYWTVPGTNKYITFTRTLVCDDCFNWRLYYFTRS